MAAYCVRRELQPGDSKALDVLDDIIMVFDYFPFL